MWGLGTAVAFYGLDLFWYSKPLKENHIQDTAHLAAECFMKFAVFALLLSWMVSDLVYVGIHNPTTGVEAHDKPIVLAIIMVTIEVVSFFVLMVLGICKLGPTFFPGYLTESKRLTIARMTFLLWNIFILGVYVATFTRTTYTTVYSMDVADWFNTIGAVMMIVFFIVQVLDPPQDNKGKEFELVIFRDTEQVTKNGQHESLYGTTPGSIVNLHMSVFQLIAYIFLTWSWCTTIFNDYGRLGFARVFLVFVPIFAAAWSGWVGAWMEHFIFAHHVMTLAFFAGSAGFMRWAVSPTMVAANEAYRFSMFLADNQNTPLEWAYGTMLPTRIVIASFGLVFCSAVIGAFFIDTVDGKFRVKKERIKRIKSTIWCGGYGLFKSNGAVTSAFPKGKTARKTRKHVAVTPTTNW